MGEAFKCFLFAGLVYIVCGNFVLDKNMPYNSEKK